MLFLVACNNNKNENSDNIKETATKSNAPVQSATKFIPWEIVNEYPHDPNAFTEGIEFYDGFLYESTGEYGYSELRKVEIKTGKVVQSVRLEHKYFGEGLTILNGKIYQLTYREKIGFVYDLASLKKEKTFSINAAEGWGMTNNGTFLVFDDGTNVFHYIDPQTFKEVKSLKVTDENGEVDEINEPEMINGFIYANKWRTDLILKIDTATGKVVGRADLSDLRQKTGIQRIAGSRKEPDVMNGIAYDKNTNRIFITGKNWNKLFEIKLDN